MGLDDWEWIFLEFQEINQLKEIKENNLQFTKLGIKGWAKKIRLFFFFKGSSFHGLRIEDFLQFPVRGSR